MLCAPCQFFSIMQEILALKRQLAAVQKEKKPTGQISERCVVEILTKLMKTKQIDIVFCNSHKGKNGI